MDIGNFPQAGDRLFLMQREVVVTRACFKNKSCTNV